MCTISHVQQFTASCLSPLDLQPKAIILYMKNF
jgi:hypothetical protein